MGAIEIPESSVYHFFTKGRLKDGRGGFGGVICDGLGNKLGDYNGVGDFDKCIAFDYLALIEGFELLDARRNSVVVCHVNNETVVKQLSGKFEARKEYLKKLVGRLDEVSRLVGGVSYDFALGHEKWMERARLLAGFAIDGREIS